jgi:hypothetical protein
MKVVTASLLGLVLCVSTLGQQSVKSKVQSPGKQTFAELQPELDNRCFRAKSAAEQWQLLRDLDALSDAEFKKTIADLNAINAADRLLGTQGCNEGK